MWGLNSNQCKTLLMVSPKRPAIIKYFRQHINNLGQGNVNPFKFQVTSLSSTSCNFQIFQPVRTLVTTTKLESASELLTKSDIIALSEKRDLISPAISQNIENYIESVQQGGKVGVLFSDSQPVQWMVDLLYVLKDLPGMTWMGVIIVGTVLIRAIVGVPIAVTQIKAIGRLEQLKPEFLNLAEELKREGALAVKFLKWDEKTLRKQFTKSYKKHFRRIVEENNCHPMRNFSLSLIQVPVWICFSSALRNVVYALPLPRTPEQLERWMEIYKESPPWVESLVITDPVVFPLIFLVSNFMNIEFSRRQKLQNVPQTRLHKVLPWVFRGGIVVIAWIATSVPSAVSMYWATSSSIAFAQNVFLSTKTAKSMFKIPVTTAQSTDHVSKEKAT